MWESWEEGGEEVTCRDLHSLKSLCRNYTPLPSLSPLLPSPHFFFPRDNRANFLQGNDRLRHPKLSLAFLPPSLFSPMQILPLQLFLSDPSRKLTVWQFAWRDSSYFGIHITGLLAYALTSHKTNTFLAVDENKMRARDESGWDLSARLIYTCRNAIC